MYSAVLLTPYMTSHPVHHRVHHTIHPIPYMIVFKVVSCNQPRRLTGSNMCADRVGKGIADDSFQVSFDSIYWLCVTLDYLGLT